MTSKDKSKEALEQAMAEALASVEKAERERREAAGTEAPPEGNGGERAAEAPAAPAAEDETEETAAEAAALRDQLLRLAADFDNYRKRAHREMEETRRYAIEQLLGDLVPVLDNLDRALAHTEGSHDPVVQGIRMVAKQIVDVLGRYGVTTFSSLGQPFDPERHEAVGKTAATDQAPGTVLEELVKGYFLRDRLLRPAQVIVAAPDDERAAGEEQA